MDQILSCHFGKLHIIMGPNCKFELTELKILQWKNNVEDTDMIQPDQCLQQSVHVAL